MGKALPLCLLAALLICGCGGSSSPSGSQTQPAGTQSTSSGEGGQSGSPAPQGGEASIEGFGEEASGAQRAAILAAFEAYLEAIASKDYAGACAQMAPQLHESLRALAGKAFAGQSCAQILAKLLSPEAPQLARAQAHGKVTRVRVEGERAFVVFHAPGAKLFEMTMSEEGGEWRAASASAGVLVPEL